MDKNKTKKWDKARAAEYHKEYYEANKDRIAEYHKQWYNKNKEYIKNYCEENKEKILQKQQERHKLNPEKRSQDWQKWYKVNKIRSPKRRFTEAKHSAKKRKLEWPLTLEEYAALIVLPCFYCENQLGEPVKRSTGLDRLDCDQGYHISNVVSCCYTCNSIKHMFLSPEEMKLVAKTLIEFRKQKK